MKLNLRQTVIDFLKSHPEERFSARRIALWIFETQREACEEKRKRSRQNLTSDTELLQQIVAEIGANRPEIQKKEPRVRTTEGRPRLYYYAGQAEYDEILRPTHDSSGQTDAGGGRRPTSFPALTEHDLYPLLCSYLHAEFGLYPKRIDEKRASNRRGPNGNRWLFPDLAAMEDLGREWNADIRDCVREYGDARCRLWSFEVKLKLNRSNVREAWFQTVSNSSWSNYGYLVAAEVEDADTMKELRLLAAAHGIGLIVLDTEDPTEGSEIRIPARERAEVDWDSCNRLAEENADFRDFIRQIRQFHQTGDIKTRDWDLPNDSQ
ncbi:MAG: HrgA protein [Rhodocyclaceae bacterium]|nr:HrgA protein [Rhodocyclaceae bacterium]